MKKCRATFGPGLAAVMLLAVVPAPAAEETSPRSAIPYVATRSDTVQDMLWMADVGEDDVVYDLGSGDGRIVIAAVRDFGARRAVGIEIDPERVREGRENAKKAGVEDRVEFIEGDLFSHDFREATVVTLFLGHGPNIKLRPKLFRMLKPGTRVLSHQFSMGEWRMDKKNTTRTHYLGMWGEAVGPFGDNRNVPAYSGEDMHFGQYDKIMMWVIPAPVAGFWRGKVETAEGPQDFELTLHQRLSAVSGTFCLPDREISLETTIVDNWGTHLRIWHWSYDKFHLRFDGHIHGNAIEGTLGWGEPGYYHEAPVEAQRDPGDYTGIWEWPCASGPRPVRLHIERCDSGFTATYRDGEKEFPVRDFYDLGDGFYFTLFIAEPLSIDPSGKCHAVTKDTGWLIGEAVAKAGGLEGSIRFYPETIGYVRDERPNVFQPWAPHKVEP